VLDAGVRAVLGRHAEGIPEFGEVRVVDPPLADLVRERGGKRFVSGRRRRGGGRPGVACSPGVACRTGVVPDRSGRPRVPRRVGIVIGFGFGRVVGDGVVGPGEIDVEAGVGLVGGGLRVLGALGVVDRRAGVLAAARLGLRVGRGWFVDVRSGILVGARFGCRTVARAGADVVPGVAPEGVDGGQFRLREEPFGVGGVLPAEPVDGDELLVWLELAGEDDGVALDVPLLRAVARVEADVLRRGVLRQGVGQPDRDRLVPV
jgi:hypothetical protein